MKVRLFSVALFVLFVKPLMAQTFEVDADFNGIFDNREYTSTYNSEKETVFGAQMNVAIGPATVGGHTFRAGINYFYEFGSEILAIKPAPILYYAYANDQFNLKFGAFPREKHPVFPVALLSELFVYYNPTIDGILLNQTGKDYQATLFCDWIGRQSENTREQFMTGFAGNYRLENLFAEGYGYIYHDGRRTVSSTTDYIDDYLGGVVMIGYDLTHLLPLDKAEIKTGWLISSHRDRLASKTHTVNHSSYSEIEIASHRFGAEVFLKFGGKHQLAFGDQFYTTLNNYIRTNLYYVPIRTNKVEARFTWSLHTYNSKLNHQQIFVLRYFIH